MNILVTTKWYIYPIAFTMGPLFVFGPLVFLIFLAQKATPLQTLGVSPFFLLLSAFFAYQMHDNVSKVELKNETVTWHYMLLPISKTESISNLIEILPLKGAVPSIENLVIDQLFGSTRGFMYKFKTGSKFSVVSLDMNNSKKLFLHCTNHLKKC